MIVLNLAKCQLLYSVSTYMSSMPLSISSIVDHVIFSPTCRSNLRVGMAGAAGVALEG
jgi:hypothetical protein